MASSPLLLYLLHNVRTNTGELNSRPFGGGSWPEPDHADSGLLVSITMTVASQFLLVFCFYLFLRSYRVLYKSWQQSKQNKTMIWLFLLIRFVAILSAASHSSRRWAQERGYCLTQSSHGILSNKKRLLFNLFTLQRLFKHNWIRFTHYQFPKMWTPWWKSNVQDLLPRHQEGKWVVVNLLSKLVIPSEDQHP